MFTVGERAAEVSMKRMLKIARYSLATLLAAAAALFIWDYIATHPLGHVLQYRVEQPGGGYGGATVYVGQPDIQTYLNGNEGYAWEIKPVQITEQLAVLDFRVKHFDHAATFEEMRAQLQMEQLKRLTLRTDQKIRIAAPDGATVSLSGSIL